TIRQTGLGGADPVRRIRDRAAVRLSRWIDGREPVVLRLRRRHCPGRRRTGRRGRRAGAGRHPPVPGWDRVERFEGRKPLFRSERFGKRVWVVPILSGEFVIERRFGYRDGLMGGNLWFFGSDADTALAAAERGAAAAEQVPGVILPFPGGIASSGSKAGSRYSDLNDSANGSGWCRSCPANS